MPKKKGYTDLNSGVAFVDLARKRGAHIEQHGNFTTVETPKGKVHIHESRDTLDKYTVSNLKKWFRLLGLLLFPLICVGIRLLQYYHMGIIK